MKPSTQTWGEVRARLWRILSKHGWFYAKDTGAFLNFLHDKRTGRIVLDVVEGQVRHIEGVDEHLTLDRTGGQPT